MHTQTGARQTPCGFASAWHEQYTCTRMKQYTVSELRQHLASALDRAECGEPVGIARRGSLFAVWQRDS